jgi:hypothetical protein
MSSRCPAAKRRRADRRTSSGPAAACAVRAGRHPGIGGSVGFADPEARMSFGYVMNKHGSGAGLGDRGQS